jgi:RNA polymerase sigma factor (sigma-70 family)
VIEQAPSLLDRSWFDELVDRYQDAGFAYAQAVLRDSAAAEDATQAAFLTAWLHLRELRDTRAFGAWFRRIVRTECFRIIRRTRPTLSLDALETSDMEPRHDDGAKVELRIVLNQAIAALPEDDRTVISLRYLSDFSYAEMAEFLELPVSTIKKRLHDARGKLRKWFHNHTDDPYGRHAFRDVRPSADRRFKERVMGFTDFLENIARNDVIAVATALDEHPEFLTTEATAQRFSSVSATALSAAAACGRIEIVKLLLARGAATGLPSTAVSPIAFAAIEGRDEIVTLLRESGIESDIFAAAAMGDADAAGALLSTDSALALSRTPDARTPLHFARSVAVAELLIRYGAEVDASDAHGQTPLQWIAQTGRHKELCAYLRAHGARAESKDIFSACAFGDVAAVKQFLSSDQGLVRARRAAGSGVPASSVGFTVLHEAATRGEHDIARLLLQFGADANAIGGQNAITPLHAAAAGGHIETVELLLRSGADRIVRDQAVGATASEWARFFGHLDVAHLLEAEAP